MTLKNLSMRQLIDVLKTLKNGAIGFDVFRNPETNTKEKLLAHIAMNHADADIIAAVQSVTGSASSFEDAQQAYQSDAASYEAETPPPIQTTPQQPTQPPQAIPADAQALGQQIAALIAQAAPKAPSLDEAKIDQMIGAALFEYESTLREISAKQIKEALANIDRPTRVVIETKATAEIKDLGLQHKNFPLLLKACQARQLDGHKLNLWLKGPAGSGKTTAAKNIAKALNMPFHFNGAIDTKYDLTGFIDAAGNYHRTAFREAFEHGGVYLFDEVDSSSPSAVLAFNAALANGVARFPDGNVNRHADCVILAGANTSGLGASNEYVGRFKQDAAFLDRFALIDWPLDEKLERALATDTDWFERVKEVRKAVSKRALKNHMISPRATLYGSALLAAGIDLSAVEAMTLRKGLPVETWEEIANAEA